MCTGPCWAARCAPEYWQLWQSQRSDASAWQKNLSRLTKWHLTRSTSQQYSSDGSQIGVSLLQGFLMLVCRASYLYQSKRYSSKDWLVHTNSGTAVRGRALAYCVSRSSECQSALLATDIDMNAARRLIRGVIFDMDGTLTVPVIDFAEMRCAPNSFSLLQLAACTRETRQPLILLQAPRQHTDG